MRSLVFSDTSYWVALTDKSDALHDAAQSAFLEIGDAQIVTTDDVQITHINLNDQTVEGLRHKTKPVFSVQYHPEAYPGPKDNAHLFDEFAAMVKKAPK